MKKQSISWPSWETVKLIGQGSFGTVYEIQRDIFGDVEKAALKVITIPQNASDIDEMYNDGYDEESIASTFKSHLKSIVAEYSMMRKMNGCANIVNCDDVRYVQHDDGIGWDIYIKMELLSPLTKALSGDISEDTVIKIGKDICTALELCKRYEIVHRDIKPQNIFVSPNGDYKLGDFGIAKTIEKTMGGTKIGTYKYMAPEVYNNQPYGSAADIYSLGLVLYWLLNKKRMPFLPMPPAKLSASMDETARNRRLSGEALPPPVNGSEELKRIVLKACAYKTEDRYAYAAQMLLDLNRISEQLAVNTIQEQNATSPDTEQNNCFEQEYFSEKTIGVFSQFEEKREEIASGQSEERKIGVFSKVSSYEHEPVFEETVTDKDSQNTNWEPTQMNDSSVLDKTDPEKTVRATAQILQNHDHLKEQKKNLKKKLNGKTIRGAAVAIVVVIAICVAVSMITQSSCAPQYSQTIHRYTYHVEACTWIGAYSSAIEKGGYLVHIDSQEEWDHIIQEIESLGYQDKYFFIGGRRNLNGTSYHWVEQNGVLSEVPLNDEQFWGNELWFDGEPSIEYNGDEEFFMEMNRDLSGVWGLNDVKQNMLYYQPNKIAYIVEYDE